MNDQDVSQYIIHFSYLGIFLWFAFIEQITPVPEEVSLISLGYIAMHTSLNVYVAAAVAIFGLTVADNLFYYLSYKGSKLTQKITGRTNNKILEKVKINLQKHAVRTLIVLALLPKLRFLSPVISAAAGISWRLFFWVNMAATAFYTTLYMFFGIFFHNSLQKIFKELHQLQHSLFGLLMLIAAVLIILSTNRMLKKKS